MKLLISAIAVCSLVSVAAMANAGTLPHAVQAGIDAGNQAWIDGVKIGDVQRIIATYTENAVDCGPSGECITGRTQIERHVTTQLASLGRARSASVQSWGSTQHGNFVYEWGQAKATFDGGKRLVEKYLTVWQRQADGSWKIFRNLVLPSE